MAAELQSCGRMETVAHKSATAKMDVLVLHNQVMTDEQMETLRRQISVYSTICSQLVKMHKAMCEQQPCPLPSFLMGQHMLYDLAAGTPGYRPSSRQRWTPSQTQLQILERLFEQGTATPNKQKIKEITMELSQHGQISETNVYNWFQNRKARAKRKQLLPQKEGESEIETDDEFPREKRYKPQSDSNPHDAESGHCEANAEDHQRNHGIVQNMPHTADQKQSGIHAALLPSEDETKPLVSFGRTVNGICVNAENDFIQSLTEVKPIYSSDKVDNPDHGITQTSDARRMLGENAVLMDSHGHMLPTNDMKVTSFPLHGNESYAIFRFS